MKRILSEVKGLGYVVSDKKSEGARIIQITSPNGAFWSRTIFRSVDSLEVLKRKMEILTMRCERLLLNYV